MTWKFKSPRLSKVHWNPETFLNAQIAVLRELSHAHPPSTHYRAGSTCLFVRGRLGETKNLDYEVVEVQNEPEGFDESEADAVPIDFVQEREDIDKMKAYTEFFEYCRERLISLGAKTIGDLPAEEQKIIAEKQSALVEKYGATKYGPFYVQ